MACTRIGLVGGVAECRIRSCISGQYVVVSRGNCPKESWWSFVMKKSL